MLSVKRKKLISSLLHKKYRDKHGLFLLEGDKIIRDALEQNDKNLIKIEEVHATKDWISELPILPQTVRESIHESEAGDLKAVSSMTTSPGVIALASIPSYEFNTSLLRDQYTILLDSIRDPGNMGTILRTADWFGIQHIICSPDCVDAFNPKVVQASMGAILRVKVYYEALPAVVRSLKRMRIRIFGTSLHGSNLFDAYIKRPAAIIFGNESKGVSSELLEMADEEILIPGVVEDHAGSESLNVASSVAIIGAELHRREV